MTYQHRLPLTERSTLLNATNLSSLHTSVRASSRASPMILITNYLGYELYHKMRTKYLEILLYLFIGVLRSGENCGWKPDSAHENPKFIRTLLQTFPRSDIEEARSS